MKYEYEVEYETNGEKPDLPGDVSVEVKYVTGEWCEVSYALDKWDFSINHEESDLTHFRIVDERYKPNESVSEIPESKSNSENVSGTWYERGDAAPPVGTWCEYAKIDSAQSVFHKCRIIAYEDGEPVIKTEKGYYYRRPTNKFIYRPIQSERDKVIEAACFVFDGCSGEFPPVKNESLVSLFYRLYDAGMLKLPD